MPPCPSSITNRLLPVFGFGVCRNLITGFSCSLLWLLRATYLTASAASIVLSTLGGAK
ncbi:hypothetical protein KCP76_01975 [Salmonella enterica subsp. enterica serovar Weltevreden]|nr:hypothetical protein KCP76_01975 [Salmonella enterica subsp. enterica serovar Weltevreden]